MAFDTSAPLRGPHRLNELAAAIVAAEVPESHWLEWKSSLDLSTPAGRFAAARTVIAFANRDPLVAARVCGGEGYLVIGVDVVSV
ncbi:RNA-binding domain-containing protein [Mycolicibacterium cosmeticum]|uniref:RNA-binding domain-containing protein n=1 Tax=Mycolicibacterium cosmeticum TaxID=258533 RepID=UPI003204BDCB